ncbi:MAG: flagellar hook-basal body protein [Planctomycetota bacterium]|jgi:flagellar hook protein FlgE
MALGSVLHTALSGISAAELLVRTVGNNLANFETPGFKASTPRFATQVPQTNSLGAAPSHGTGGSNPVQVGLGVGVGQISTDFTQGSIMSDANPSSLAIQGQGFFVVEGPHGQQAYTRVGTFGLNADHELVTGGRHRVLGFAADDGFEIQTGELTTLTIPLGEQVAGRSGSPAVLTGFHVTQDGRVHGQFTDGVSRNLGQIRLATFANPGGMEALGDNLYRAGPNSGLPVESNPGEAGAGRLISGAIETSNTDVGRSLVGLLEASVMFRANIQVLDTADQMLDDLMSVRRT